MVPQIAEARVVLIMILIQINVVIGMIMTSLRLLCVVTAEEELQVIVTNHIPVFGTDITVLTSDT